MLVVVIVIVMVPKVREMVRVMMAEVAGFVAGLAGA